MKTEFTNVISTRVMITLEEGVYLERGDLVLIEDTYYETGIKTII